MIRRAKCVCGLALAAAGAIFSAPAMADGLVPSISQDFANTKDAGDQWLRVAVDAVGSQTNNVSWPSQYDGAWDQLSLNFDIRIQSGDPDVNDRADGFGFKWINAANHGTSGAFYTAGEEPNLAGSLGLGFDIWNNDAMDNFATTSLSLHNDGAVVGQVNLRNDAELAGQPKFSWETGEPINVTMQILPGVGGADGNVTVVALDHLGNAHASSFTVPGLAAYTGRPGFDARTGGAFANQDMRNFTATYSVDGNTIVNSFDIAGGWAETHNQSWVPQVIGDVIVNLDGGTPLTLAGTATLTDDGILQLTAESGGQLGKAAFDARVSTAEGIVAEFDFRGLNADATRADGMSFMLLDPNLYPDAASIPDDGGAPGGIEDPYLTNSLGIGFDTFNNDDTVGSPQDDPEGANPVGNHVSISFNGTKIAQTNLPIAELDLLTSDPNVWHHATVQVLGDQLTVLLTDGVDGSVHLAFSDVVPGLSALTEVRPAFGARTGGAFDAYQVDNVSVSPVPEPMSLGLIGMAASIWALWRRRR